MFVDVTGLLSGGGGGSRTRVTRFLNLLTACSFWV